MTVAPVGASTEILSEDATRVTGPERRRRPAGRPTRPRTRATKSRRPSAAVSVRGCSCSRCGRRAGRLVRVHADPGPARKLDRHRPSRRRTARGKRGEPARGGGTGSECGARRGSDVEQGFVARQEPGDGAEVAPGSEVTIFVSTGRGKPSFPMSSGWITTRRYVARRRPRLGTPGGLRTNGPAASSDRSRLPMKRSSKAPWSRSTSPRVRNR